MIDALIKRVSVAYKCYEMYAHRGGKVKLTARVLRSIKKCRGGSRGGGGAHSARNTQTFSRLPPQLENI
jgi:hypothetical protein